MRIPSGVTDQYLYFVAVDATDLKTREPGLTGFTVYRSRNGGAAAAYTTPTVNETDATNMPGVYELLLDEDMTLDAGDQSQEVCLHITHASMAPVTRVFELYRPSVTAGETLTVASGVGSANAVQVSGDATAADNLEAAYDGTGYQIIRTGTAQAGAASTITLDASASASDDFYNYALIQIVSGTGANQARFITDYVGLTQVATVSPNWVTNPANDSVFVIRPFGQVPGASAPTAGEVADAVWDEARAGHVGAGSFGEGVVVASIATGAITAAAIATDAIDADALKADAAAEIADAVLDEALSGHTTVGTLGQVLQPARTGTAQAGTASTITLDASASATDDLYVGGVVQLTSGTGAGQARLITDYNGTTKAATVNSNWVTNPASDSVFVIWPGDSATSVWDELRTNHTGAGSFGEYVKASVTHFGGTAGTFAAGRPEVNTSHIAGAAVSTASAQIGVNVVQISGDSTAADNLESYTDGTTPQPVNATQISGDATAADNLEAALDGTGGVTLTAAVTGNITGNLTGSVGSVTGNVGGSVASVTADVGLTQAGADKVWLSASRTLTKHPGLKKNTASQRIYFLMVDATDGVTPEPGLTVTAERSIDGGVFNGATGTVAEVADGWYVLTTTQADTNGDSLVFQFSATGAGTRTYWVLTY